MDGTYTTPTNISPPLFTHAYIVCTQGSFTRVVHKASFLKTTNKTISRRMQRQSQRRAIASVSFCGIFLPKRNLQIIFGRKFAQNFEKKLPSLKKKHWVLTKFLICFVGNIAK